LSVRNATNLSPPLFPEKKDFLLSVAYDVFAHQQPTEPAEADRKAKGTLTAVSQKPRRATTQ